MVKGLVGPHAVIEYQVVGEALAAEIKTLGQRGTVEFFNFVLAFEGDSFRGNNRRC